MRAVTVIAAAITVAILSYFTEIVIVAASVANPISTVVGTGTGDYNGDNVQGTAAQINGPQQIFLDTAGNLYIADRFNVRVRKYVVSTGVITTIAGTGDTGYNGDSIAATSARLNIPQAVYVNSAGRVFLCDFGNSRVRAISTTGIITTIIGTGVSDNTGDDGPGTSARIRSPSGKSRVRC